MNILGISAYYHDSAACLIRDGVIVAAAQEERFTRKKHDSSFPVEATRYCLNQGGLRVDDLDAVAFYDKPFLTFERLLETYVSFAPSGIRSFMKSMPVWLKEKLFLRRTLEVAFQEQFGSKPRKVLFSEHHESHAASAFYPSPYQEAAVLCLDGVGEWATTSAWHGKDNRLEPLWEIRFPHSLGLLYSAFTYYTGFKVNSGEYKVMGLAPYGRPLYVQTIYDHLIDVKADGSFRLNMDYFDYCTGLTMTNSRFNELFEGPPREPESSVTQKEMDLARSIQVVTEEIVLRIGRRIHEETGLRKLCLAGGVALNCVANGRLLREGPFDGIWIQPAAGDAGGSVGSAYTTYHQYFGKPRIAPTIIAKDATGSVPRHEPDLMQGGYLGPEFRKEEIESFLKSKNIPYQYLEDDAFFDRVSTDLAQEKVVGWFQGRMEFGPRALGGRSIIGDARSTKMQSVMNLKIKYRESFRPFAPSVLREKVSEYFEMSSDSPYMLMVAPVKESLRKPMSEEDSKRWGIDLLNVPKSDIPAVTHVDYSARIQTVDPVGNPRYYRLISEFERKTGCAVIVNTSFNVRGEPIVCTPEDAYRCFVRTEMDTLVLGNFVLDKAAQPKVEKDSSWMKEFALD